jgi:hypothetical protein
MNAIATKTPTKPQLNEQTLIRAVKVLGLYGVEASYNPRWGWRTVGGISDALGRLVYLKRDRDGFRLGTKGTDLELDEVSLFQEQLDEVKQCLNALRNLGLA